MVMEVVQEDYDDDGGMQCTSHPYKNSSPGGICAFCLQEKLGKLVSCSSSPFSAPVFPSSSSSASSPPSYRSDRPLTTTAASSVEPIRTNLFAISSNTHNPNLKENNYNHSKKSKIPLLLTQKKKKKTISSSDQSNGVIFKRSKSSVTPRHGVHFMEANEIDDFSPHKRRFWSFLHLYKHPTSKNSQNVREICHPKERKKKEYVVVEENESPDQVSFDRKVSRSRSVGCGSRRFSGDFFERISTGFGDCTLRRVESQREGKSRVRRSGAGGQDFNRERVKCGGLFSGFAMTSSSSSSSSYMVPSSNEYNSGNCGAKPSATAAMAAHGRSKSWVWAFASPMRAFKPSGKGYANKSNGAPNLAAIPSLLAVSS